MPNARLAISWDRVKKNENEEIELTGQVVFRRRWEQISPEKRVEGWREKEAKESWLEEGRAGWKKKEKREKLRADRVGEFIVENGRVGRLQFFY